jgi:hypothetical protein
MVVGWFILSFRSIYNQFAGPQVIDGKTLTAITEPQKQFRYYFQVDKAHMSPLLYQDLYVRYNKTTHQEISREVQADYHLMIVPGALLLVKSSAELADPCTVAGALVPIPADVKTNFLNVLRKNSNGTIEKIEKFMKPTMLDTTRFQSGGGAWALLFMVPPFFLSLWNIKAYMARRDDFMAHPICKQLKKYGDPRELAGVIEQEVRDSINSAQFGGLTITKNWILSRHVWGMEVRKLDDLVWAYRHQQTTTVYFVPVSRTQSMYMIFSDKGKVTAGLTMVDCERILKALIARAPGAIYGYSDELSRRWNKSPAAVIAEVDANKAKFKAEAKSKSKFSDNESGT